MYFVRFAVVSSVKEHPLQLGMQNGKIVK